LNLTQRRLTSLGDLKWEVLRVDKKTGQPTGNPFPGRVPGDILSDLLANGMIEDPYRGRNSDKCKWVNNYDWLYRARFEGRCPPGERRFLRFMGVDYESWFRLGGRVIGSHEGMFSRAVFEITALLEDLNELEVLLVGQADSIEEKLSFGNPVTRTERVRIKKLKAQYSYGWDFAPALKGAGIWDDAFLHATSGPIAIDDLWIAPDVNGLVNIVIYLTSRASGSGAIRWRLEPAEENGPAIEGEVETEYVTGPQRFPITVLVEKPALWNPWEMGAPYLYKFSAEAVGDGDVSDSISDTFGFRSIGYEANPGAPSGCDPWTVVVNGRRMFMRGINWVPLDSLLGRITAERYESALRSIREMGANVIRVWGGGLREKRAFYDLCDKIGLLVWQEFPLACAFFNHYPRSQRFRKTLFNEVGDIIRQLRNHPCVMLWSSGNEVHLRRNRAVLDIIHRQVESLDGTRRFHPISPSRGDAHNWVVWHGKGNLEDYLEEKSPVISEFGLQAVPNRETVEWMFGPEGAWPPDKKTWTHHNIQFDKMNKYASRAPQDGSLSSYIEATQRMQAHVLKTAVERWRRLKFRHSGVGIWQFNEPWPCICWSVVDYFGRPKQAYAALKMAMAPLMVAAYHPLKEWRQGQQVPFDIAVVNDLHQDFGDLIAMVKIGSKNKLQAKIKVRANSVAVAEDLSISLDSSPPWVIHLTLLDPEGNELAQNEHDLMIFDPQRASPYTRYIFRLMWKWMTKERP